MKFIKTPNGRYINKDQISSLYTFNFKHGVEVKALIVDNCSITIAEFATEKDAKNCLDEFVAKLNAED